MPATCPDEIREALSGPCPTIRTPFTRDGDIDFDAVRRHVDFVIDAGAKVVILTVGDSLYTIITDDEVAALTKVVVDHAKGRALTVAAERMWWTGKVVEFGKYCRQIGADMLMALPPDWAGSTTIETLVAHYNAIAEQIPVMLVTNYLGVRGTQFAVDATQAFHDRVSGIVAVKDDVCGEYARKLCLIGHDRWAIFAGGLKQNHMNMHLDGVDGFLSTFITFKPEITWRYWNAVQANDMDTARAVIRDYDMPVFDYLKGLEGSFDAGIHGILELYGIASRYRRPPYHSLTDAQMDGLAGILKGKGLL